GRLQRQPHRPAGAEASAVGPAFGRGASPNVHRRLGTTGTLGRRHWTRPDESSLLPISFEVPQKEAVVETIGPFSVLRQSRLAGSCGGPGSERRAGRDYETRPARGEDQIRST